ncbi:MULTISPECIES: isopentenyl-diphosphate Delta-isomerase [Nocardia]|uniref:Isopentenyl-diphosphate Delta-isomerase n=2 Tax=Nocardia TaxID=1817 RepID=A0A846YBM3_9NOCA|nr:MULTISPECIES: isopentenyl-diphosphate Delta-isomerase [Nocardia]NKY57026.1 isopentenyl-diphosphate Delta-isomerase [Nocardia flavorosea]
MTGRSEERVVLLDDSGEQVGSMPKTLVHHTDTPLHLGFSCYLFDRDGRLLVTRRALSKRTWPGVWTNSCCGHPAPGEPVGDAVPRRVREELGLGIDTPTCLLPRFRYSATAPDGTMENEVCPVFCARADGPVHADAAEVMDWRWVPWPDFAVAAGLRWPISPWAADQVPQLAAAPGFSLWTDRR